MFAGVGPLLLGALQASGRLTSAQLGEAGTAELVMMGLSAAVAESVLGARHLRGTAIVTGLLYALFNEATTRVDGDTLILVRALAGVPSGVLIWMTTGLIVRSSRPARGSGIYMTLQTLAQLVMATGITACILAPFGVNGGFRCLAGLGIACALAGFAVPRRYPPLAALQKATGGWPSARGWVALAAVFAFQAFIVGVWIYFEPLSRQSGHDGTVAGLAISVSLGAQVAGGIAATLLAGRISAAAALVPSLGLLTVLLAVFMALPGAPVFLLASAAFGFLWMFATPFFTPLAINADAGRRAAMVVPGASLLGCGAGPLAASFLVTDGDMRGALILGMGLAVLSLTGVAALHLTRAKDTG
jgi:predicted MFS family arabinose efflux permease